MSYWRIRFRIPGRLSESMTQSLTDLGALAVTIENAGEGACYEAAYPQEPDWPEHFQTGLFPGHVDRQATISDVESQFGKNYVYDVSKLVDQDWEKCWLSGFTPLQVGPNLWVCPSWLNPPVASDINLIIDPGLAFGTGTHPTTALCLDWLGRNKPYNKRVMDYGCGSGILAIASLKLGAAHAWGVDIDPRALVTSRDNAKRNEVSDRYSSCPAQALPENLHVDLLIANILADVLIDLSHLLTSLVCQSGAILLTGILREQELEVQEAYATQFDFHQVRRDEWSLLVGYKS